MNILILGYACSPNCGSEPGKTWELATGLARANRVSVITHVRWREQIEKGREGIENPNLTFYYVGLPYWLDPWKRFGQDTMAAIRYSLWQVAAFLRARAQVKSERFDVAHHISWGTVTGPTFGWALGLPFVWGPLGGGHVAPLQMWRYLRGGWLKEAFRNLRVKSARVMPWARLAASHASVTIASNPETGELLESLGATHVLRYPCAGVADAWFSNREPARNGDREPQLTWVGRLEPHKAPALAIEAFALVRRKYPSRLVILGAGPLWSRCRCLARELGVGDCVEFRGAVPYQAVRAELVRSHAFIFTSLRDTFPQTVLEAMACCTPVVALDHQGLGILPQNSVVRVPLNEPRQVAPRLAHALERLLASEPARREAALKGWDAAQAQRWGCRVDYFLDLYRRSIEHFEVPCLG